MAGVSRPHRMQYDVMVKCRDFGVQQTWAKISALFLINDAIVSDVLKLPGPHFPHLYKLLLLTYLF